ncbi:hypothetical protein B0A49_10226 [Cryomyces minteri]|uniref:F-box domain-containing protein n=1 Tax=Cryomyces minteri TaxID=331657 RepID=A0A4U0WGT8_9PEZI|nr:hypothetical protein B0A49_10226 [Cryomyces minteri]
MTLQCLPAELRQHIFSYVIDEFEPLSVMKDCSVPSVCRQFQDDVQRVLYCTTIILPPFDEFSSGRLPLAVLPGWRSLVMTIPSRDYYAGETFNHPKRRGLLKRYVECAVDCFPSVLHLEFRLLSSFGHEENIPPEVEDLLKSERFRGVSVKT